MSKEKNKNTFRIGALLLVACLISSVMLSGTFAKYTSEFAGEDTALVAKWSLSAQDGNANPFALSPADAAVLDLFEHAYDTNILTTAGTDKIIAPGVSGAFTLSITNSSDVAADITFLVEELETNVAVPMEFSVVDNFVTPANIKNSIAGLTTALNGLNINLDETDGTDSVTVYWRWAFDGTTATASATDATDTVLGAASATAAAGGSRTSYGIKVTLIATQVTPTT